VLARGPLVQTTLDLAPAMAGRGTPSRPITTCSTPCAAPHGGGRRRLAAWICEKWRSWSDCNGNLDVRIPRDFLLTLLTLYWATGTITTSMRDYYDNRWHGVTLGPDDFVSTPTAVAGFMRQYVFEGDPPREWAARLYNIRRWTPMPAGGHFAAVEEPERLARDIASFFADL
jgi:pimeloyl-ACP methyl ester carboxylesterase